MSSSTESLCRICLEDGATIPIFEDARDVNRDGKNCYSTVQKKLSVCLNEKFEDVAGHPRYICHHCQVTLNTVYDFINKYKKTCKILQNSLESIVKQENITYEDYDDFVYPEEDNTTKSLELKPTKTEVKIEFEDGEHFIKKIKPLCKLKTNEIRKSKRGTTVKTKTIKQPLSKNKTNVITSSLLEGVFTWNGEDWCTTSPQKTSDNEKARRENERDNQHPTKVEKKALDSVLCESCGERFKSRDYFRLHVDVKHKSQAVTCSICSVTVASQHYLNRHIKRVHGTKDFICSKCGKGFAYKRDLSNHVKVVHEKLILCKRQPCKFCDKYYTDKKSLIIHERSVHTGERPAACTVCDKSFFHEDYLREHMRLHTGERPFPCPVCARGYAQRGNMKSHMRNHRISELSQEILSKIKPSWYRFMKP